MYESNMAYTIMKIVASFSILLGVLLFLHHFFKKIDNKNPKLMRIIATQQIAPKKIISLIEICGETLVIGISEKSISFLTKIEDKKIEEIIKRTNDKAQNSGGFKFKVLSLKQKGNK
ncbi:MAG: Flagellar biosynthesis protein, FliO [Candidatus Methanoperedenaceae archaeon GB37]|nr:MAG: Flagellar biosynthesis protein, FliO [Candidatus Methanoperedenaceae archaeon GB37]